jgi:hypothetical protein
MKADQLRERNALVARGEALLDRFPKRTGEEFIREMTAVANGLEAIAQSADRADRSGSDALERARTWRHLGNACYDLGTGRQRPQLERASGAFAHADALLANLNEPVEKLKVNYSWGRTLLLLCDGQDPQLAVQARDRFRAALALAPEHLPAAVSHLQTALTDATRVVDLLTTAQGLGHQINQLKQELAEHDQHESSAQDGDPEPGEDKDESEPAEDEAGSAPPTSSRCSECCSRKSTRTNPISVPRAAPASRLHVTARPTRFEGRPVRAIAASRTSSPITARSGA